MPLDFPSNPSDGQVYDNYYYDATAGVWQSNGGTTLPNIFKNATYTTAQTYLVPVTAKGKLGQTANLQEWTDSTGTVLASISSSGTMTVQSIVSVQPLALVPTGSMMPFAGSTAPDQFLLCQGQAVSRSTYATLFSVIGTTYGAGDNSTTFNLPNLNGRVPVGKDSAQTEFDLLGEAGGSKTHTLTTAEMPSHTHTQNSHNHTQDAHSHSAGDNGHSHGGVPQLGTVSVPSGSFYGVLGSYGEKSTNTGYASVYVNNATATNQAATATNQNTGGGGAHNNLQPYLVTNYIIKA